MDRLSHELREAELEIDRAHLANPLMSEAPEHAILILLDYASRQMLRIEGTSRTFDAWGPRYGVVAGGLEVALRWVWDRVPGVNRTEHELEAQKVSPHRSHHRRWISDASRHQLTGSYADHCAKWMIDLGDAYTQFAVAYTFASEGEATLEIQEDLLVPGSSERQTLSRAYMLLARPERGTSAPLAGDYLRRKVLRDVTWKAGVPTVRSISKHRDSLIKYVAPRLTDRRFLPTDWKFGRYTIEDHRRAVDILMAEASIWMMLAQEFKTHEETSGLGVRALRQDELVALLVKHDLNVDVASAIVEDLTFGSRSIQRPDIHLQPLIPSAGNLLFVPAFLFYNEWERNLVTLLSRIPAEQAVYDRLKQSKEAQMRSLIVSSISEPIRSWWGRLPGSTRLPDIDLALTDNGGDEVVVLELKWFQAPSAPREILNRTKELRRAAKQLDSLRDFDAANPGAIASAVGAKAGARVTYAVVSESWAGQGFSADPRLPAIRRFHLSECLGRGVELARLAQWLTSEKYLPIQNADFEVGRGAVYQVGGYRLRTDASLHFLHGDQFVERTLDRL